MTPAQLRDLVRRDEEAWNAHDSTRLASLVAVNVEFRTVSLSEPIRGRDAFRQVTERYLRALPDFRIENRAVAFTDDTVAVEWRVTGTHDAPLLVELRVTGARGRLTELPRTGRRVDIPGCSVLRVDAAGLIAAVEEYWNQASMLPQLGIRPFAVGVLRQGLSRLSLADESRCRQRVGPVATRASCSQTCQRSGATPIRAMQHSRASLGASFPSQVSAWRRRPCRAGWHEATHALRLLALAAGLVHNTDIGNPGRHFAAYGY